MKKELRLTTAVDEANRVKVAAIELPRVRFDRMFTTMNDDVRELIARAYAYDRNGDEHAAIRCYDEANARGVPSDERRRFTIGYGSTLRNVGRADDAVAVLARAIADDPDYPAFAPFLALALADAGHPRAALATMLGCVLDIASPGTLGGYERALGEYHKALLHAATSP
jgi:tetratricopeptide (TPR) repeat protein